MTPKPTATADPVLDVDAIDDETPTANLPATIDNNDTSIVKFTDDEWAGVDDGDLAPPTETLLPLLPMNRKMGEGVVDPKTGERADELDFIWLARSITRAWWDKKFDERDPDDPAPKCRSVDGVNGVGRFESGSDDNPTGKCATCPAAGFQPDNVLPCNSSIEAMVATPDSADGGVSLFRLRFNGIAFSPARVYWDSFRARLPKIPAIGFLTHMKLEPFETKNGKFLKPTFSRVQQLRRERVQPLIDERDRLIDEFKRLVAEEVETRTIDIDEQNTGGPFDDAPTAKPDGDRKAWLDDEEPF